jgi:DnaJ-class molecular chaperone
MAREEQREFQIPKLETVCSHCSGKGVVGENLILNCYECDGTGFVLTDAGESVFAFISNAISRIEYRRE